MLSDDRSTTYNLLENLVFSKIQGLLPASNSYDQDVYKQTKFKVAKYM